MLAAICATAVRGDNSPREANGPRIGDPEVNARVGANWITETGLEARHRSLLPNSVDCCPSDTARVDSVTVRLLQAFRELRLETALADGGYVLRESLLTRVRVEGSIGLRDRSQGYSWGREYNPLGCSADGQARGSLAFVGHGVSTPLFGYDDYEALDVRGRIVLAFDGFPEALARTHALSAPPEGRADRKAAIARAHGAVGFILAPPPGVPVPVPPLERTSQERLFVDSKLPVIEVTAAAAQALIEGATPEGQDPFDLAAAARELARGRPHSSPFPESDVEMLVTLGRRADDAPITISVLPGTSEQSVYVVLAWDPAVIGAPRTRPVLGEGGNLRSIASLLEIVAALRRVERERSLVMILVPAPLDLTAVEWKRRLPFDRFPPAALVELHLIDEAGGASLRAVSRSEALLQMLSEAGAELNAPLGIDAVSGESGSLGPMLADPRVPFLTLAGAGADTKQSRDGWESATRMTYALLVHLLQQRP